jgi:hypothetical protein
MFCFVGLGPNYLLFEQLVIEGCKQILSDFIRSIRKIIKIIQFVSEKIRIRRARSCATIFRASHRPEKGTGR